MIKLFNPIRMMWQLKITKTKLVIWSCILLIIVLLASICLTQQKTIEKQKKDIKRHVANTKVRIVRINVGDTLSAAKVEAFRLKYEEIKESRAEDQNAYAKDLQKLKDQLSALNIRIKDMEVGVITSITASSVTTSKPVKDTSNGVKVLPKYEFFTRYDSSIVTIDDKGVATKRSRYNITPTLTILSSAKTRKNGKPHWIFPRSKFLWGKKKEYLITVDIPNSYVQKVTVVEKEPKEQ